MGERAPSPDPAGAIRREILKLQQEILSREDQISRRVDSVERPPILSERMQDGEGKRRIEHLEKLVGRWDTLVARCRAVSDSDSDMVLALARCVGDLLLAQPEGIDERWIVKLREYLAEQRSQIS